MIKEFKAERDRLEEMDGSKVSKQDVQTNDDGTKVAVIDGQQYDVAQDNKSSGIGGIADAGKTGGMPIDTSNQVASLNARIDALKVDIAVPDTEPSPKILLDAIAGAMHLAYATGATETIGNVRQPFPRLFARVGGTDRTQEIGKFGRAMEGRYYYVVSAEEFYRSREGRAFTAAVAAAGAGSEEAALELVHSPARSRP